MSKLVEDYLKLKDKHDREFWLATGGDGNADARKAKRDKYEAPLLKKMLADELRDVINRLVDLNEKRWVIKNFL